MKKRLLSLLLAMVMIVSMVPFQAFAEEADETPELLEEAVVEEIVAEETEEIIPETTEETVPETTEETVPETTEETVPETTEETVPEIAEELIPEEAALIPEGTDEVAPEGNGPSFHITFPASARKVDGIPVLTAGQKLNLSTDLSKADAKKGVEWKIVGGRTYDPRVAPLASLDEVCPDGATANGDEWDAIASIDSKGVLRTNAAVTSENYIVKVAAVSKDEELGFGTLSVLIQPPVESFYIEGSELSSAHEVSFECGLNRKYPAEDYDINNGPFVLRAVEFLPEVQYAEVKWDIKGSKNVADRKETDDNTIIVTPNAPGKLNITATSTDGSGAKVSAVINLFGETRVVDITSAPETMTAGDKPVTLSTKAYYDDDATMQIAKPKLYWDVVELRKIDNINATDDGKFIFKDENGKIYSWVYFDGTDYYETFDTTVATVKNGKLTLGKVVKDTRLLLTASGPEYWDKYNDDPLCAKDSRIIEVKAAENAKTLVFAENWSDGYAYVNPAFTYETTPTIEIPIVAAWMYPDGTIEPLGENDTVKYSASNATYADGILTPKKAGKVTLKATVGKQSVSFSFNAFFSSDYVVITNSDLSITSGKSLALNAKSWYEMPNEDEKNPGIPATTQKFAWYLLDEDDNPVTETEYAKINSRTGKLTAKDVNAKTEVKVLVADNYGTENEVTVTILPKDKTYITAYGLAVPDTFSVNTMSPYIPLEYIGVTALRGGKEVPFTITDVSVSPAKLAVISDEHLAPEETVKCIKLTGKTGKATISVTGTIEGQTKPVTVNATVNLVNTVTSIEIKRPTDKDGNELPLYVGKSLKLSAVINGREGEVPATNKKLVWHVSCYEDWEYLKDNDKTTIKNGVLKVDKSFYTEARTYYVWATSEDGNCGSNTLEIPAYAMTGAINIFSEGYWSENGSLGDALYLNNRTVTIKQGELLYFGALISDVNGNDGANPDIAWTISGNQNKIIKYKEVMMNGYDVLRVTGNKPGTVTIKAAAKDGSKKTAAIKLVVEPNTLSAPELETDKLYRSCVTAAPSIAYDYTKGNENINWLDSTDVKFSSNYDKVTTAFNEAEDVWKISVSDDAKVGKVVTITVEDVRKNINELQRAQPLSLKYTIEDPQP